MSKSGLALFLLALFMYIVLSVLTAYSFWHHDWKGGLAIFILSQAVAIKINHIWQRYL